MIASASSSADPMPARGARTPESCAWRRGPSRRNPVVSRPVQAPEKDPGPGRAAPMRGWPGTRVRATGHGVQA